MKNIINLRSVFGLTLLGVMVSLAGCSSGPTIKYEADKSAVLTNYKTYVMVPFSKTQGVTGSEPGRSLRYAPVVDSAIKNVMAIKGFTEAPKESADIAINVRATVVPKTDVTEWGMGYSGYNRWGYGGYWGSPGMGGYNVTVDQYNEGVLRVEIYDVKTKELVWVGWATDQLYEAPKDEFINQVITDILANFPIPQPKK